MKKKDINKLKMLDDIFIELLKKQFILRLKKNNSEFKEVHRIKNIRREIARNLTILSKRVV